jgi:type IV pilus assembly protein PilW
MKTHLVKSPGVGATFPVNLGIDLTSRNQYQRGMTLIEIMIALLIGVFLIGGILQIFLSTKRSYRMQENLSTLQENTRFASEFIASDLRIPGYQGCRSLSIPADAPAVKAAQPTPNTMVGLTPISAITGNEWVGGAGIRSPVTQASLTGLVNGTDVVTVAFAESCGGYLTSTMAAATAATNITIAATNSCKIARDDALIISDCASSDIIRATNPAGAANVNVIQHAGQDLSKAYAAGSEVLDYREYSYYIHNGTSGRPALYRRDNAVDGSGLNPIELIEDVENLQITYGVDSDKTNAIVNPGDGTANYYVKANSVPDTDPADLVPDWDKVVSVKVSLLLVTAEDNLADQPVLYDYDGTADINPGDRRIRRVVNSVIALRNRIP